MSIIASPLLWIILVLSVGIPAFFIAGARYVAYRLAGRPGTVPVPATGVFSIPVPRFASRRQALRTLLMLVILGTGTGIVLLRFAFGIGAVTNMTDQFAWGLWISFDVMSGVALAAGAFVMAATVHIFRIKRFEPLVRPAILTGFLGYLLVVVALIVDLGRPYNIWRPLVHWQHHSVLWEVGVCVFTYTIVLFIEFLPVILERLNKIERLTRRLPTVPLYRLLKKISIAFVILGVVLSTLHQSSLGSLWVLVPEKLSPLWYSIYLPFFFWLSAVAVGLAMVIVETSLGGRGLGHHIDLSILAGLGRALPYFLGLYLVVKLGDLLLAGEWQLMFASGFYSVLFWLEVGGGVIAPLILLALPAVRRSRTALFWSALLVVLGLVLNRFNASLIALAPRPGTVYFPHPLEFSISIAVVSAGVLAYILANRYLPITQPEAVAGAD